MSHPTRAERTRRRIESLGSRLSLPISQRALGLLEGEHGSWQIGRGYDYFDLRTYQPGEEAGLIDWKASARAGKPIIVNKQREVTSKVWLVLDTSAQMLGTSAGGQSLLDVAADGLRLFALLSLRRSDDISLVLGDCRAIQRTPFSGGYTKFDRLLSNRLRAWKPANRDLDSLLEYTVQIQGNNSLIVLASDESVSEPAHQQLLSRLSQSHPLVVISAMALNPFSTTVSGVREADSGRLMPAFLRDTETEQDFDNRRQVRAAAFERELQRGGDSLLRAGSSEAMIDAFTHLLSTRLRTSLSGFSRPAGSSRSGQARPGELA